MASLRIQRQQGLQRRVRFRQSLWQRCRMPLKCFTTTSSLENSVVSLENQVYLPTPIQPWLKRDCVLNNWKLILRPLTGIISGVSLAWSIKFKSQNFLWKNNHGHDQILIILLAFTFELFLLVGFSKKKKKKTGSQVTLENLVIKEIGVSKKTLAIHFPKTFWCIMDNLSTRKLRQLIFGPW